MIQNKKVCIYYEESDEKALPAIWNYAYDPIYQGHKFKRTLFYRIIQPPPVCAEAHTPFVFAPKVSGLFRIPSTSLR